MENASKALLMAGGVLIGVLIFALMITLFVSSKELFDTYEQTKQTEQMQQFNTNFTQYIGKKISIHEVITICNFAKQRGFKENETIIIDGSFNIDKSQIVKDIEDAEEYYQNNYSNQDVKINIVYKLEIKEYEEGYVSKICIKDRKYAIRFYGEGQLIKEEEKSA